MTFTQEPNNFKNNINTYGTLKANRVRKSITLSNPNKIFSDQTYVDKTVDLFTKEMKSLPISLVKSKCEKNDEVIFTILQNDVITNFLQILKNNNMPITKILIINDDGQIANYTPLGIKVPTMFDVVDYKIVIPDKIRALT